MTILLLVLFGGASLLQAVALVLLVRWTVVTDLGAERRGRRTACAALVEIAAQYPEAAPMALAAFVAASLPGDPTATELLRGPG